MLNEATVTERERHLRALWYAIIAFALSAVAYLFLGFDRLQMLGYAVTCFVMLTFLNRGVMFARPHVDSTERRTIPTQD